MIQFSSLIRIAKKPIDNRKGIALIMAVSAVSLLIYLAMEVMYDSNVEYVVNSQALNRTKAYYAALAGVDVSMLRIKTYLQIKKKMGKMASSMPFLEQIWKFPLIWPLELPTDINGVEKDLIGAKVKLSLMDATFRTDIEDEGSKIDLNDLASPSKVLSELAKKQLLGIFNQKIKDDDAFRDRYSSFKFEELINRISDWMSTKRDSLNGGSKLQAYQGSKNKIQPPNRAFRTLQEVRLVAEMNDELFALLEPRITIYGIKGVNPNTASKEVLMTLDEGITAEVADKIIERVQDNDTGKGPFKEGDEGVKEFWDFVATTGAKLKEDTKNIPIVTNVIVSFRISSIGLFAGTSRKITVIVFDMNQSVQRTSELLAKEVPEDQKKKDEEQKKKEEDAAKADPKDATAKSPGGEKKDEPLPKGPLRIVYWAEK